jgi:uncharacterized protein (TIGR00369 family)
MNSKTASRTYTWPSLDPAAHPLAEMSGIDFYRGLCEGNLPHPPIAHTIGWTVTAAEIGYVCLTLQPAESLMLGAAIMHGGVGAILLDSAMAGAVITTLERGQKCTSLQFSVNFLRAITEAAGPLKCEGRVLHAGRSTGVAEASLHDANGRLYARATSSLMIFRN